MGNLATQISNKTGADDEAIQSGENLLATFTNVRNETGKNNDIFNRASKAAVDMASAMNNGVVDANGLKAANIQLGKALNDPVKGVTALSKVGVSFTQQQKDQIKTLVEGGHTLKAQKIILAEVNKEFGGAAAAAADPLTRLKTILGNVSESLGGLLLPVVNKVANFIGDTFVPGIYALGSAFQGEGITSDGFVGGMERIGVKARAVFGFFKAEVLPRLKDFGGFVTGTVVPALVTLAGNLAATFGPALKDVFGFVKTEVIPRLKDFADFVGEKIAPKLAALAVSLSKNKDFLVPFAATIIAVVAGLKAWAIIQGILNVVLAANPIGLVVIGIAALVAGIIWAFKNVGWFHDALVGAFQGIQKAAQFFAPLVKAAIDVVIGVFSLWWNYYAKPILSAFWAALKFAWERAQQFASVVAAAFNAIKEPARVAIKFVIDTFLGMVENILTGASKAFGWVPGLGDKLKTAAGEFRKFRDNVNNALDGVKDQAVNIAIKYSSTGVNLTSPSSVGRRATGGPGGPVEGPGTTTSDDAGLFRLSRKEWVIKAASSMKYGDKAMASVNAGTAAIIPGFAKGGSPGLSVGTNADSGSLAKSVASSIASMATAVAKQLAKSGGGLSGAMAFGSSQQGKPYVWGASGPNGYDCSGFVSALINYAKGRNPFQRLGATGSMPWSDMAAGIGRFMVGWFKGNPGHTAATINGVNFESRGGRGVVVGPSARGAFDPLFTNHARVMGFKNGGRPGLEGDPPFDLLNPRGKQFQAQLAQVLGIKTFDTGLLAGGWAPGTLAYNGTSKHETVRTAEQEARLGSPLQVRVFIGQRELTDIVRVEIDEKNRQAANSFNL
jgi:hypothetical protein